MAIDYTLIDASTLTSTYQAINANGLDQPCWLIRIINDSTKGVHISYDGTDNHEYVPSGQTAAINSQTNSQPNNNVALFARGLIVYAAIPEGSMAGTGDIYVVGYYTPLNN